MENINTNKSESLLLKIIYNIISIICITIAILARLYTPGWLMFVIIIPGAIHSAVLILSNYNLSKFANKSLLANLLFWISCITFIMIYILQPDFSDTSEYALHGLIQDSKTLYILKVIVKYSLYINILSVILGLFINKIIKAKKSIDENIENSIKKDYSSVKDISIVLLVFCTIWSILCVFYGTINGVLFYLTVSILMIFTVIFFSKKKIYGTISGIASSILLILISPSILYKIVAIILLIFCIKIIYEEKRR